MRLEKSCGAGPEQERIGQLIRALRGCRLARLKGAAVDQLVNKRVEIALIGVRTGYDREFHHAVTAGRLISGKGPSDDASVMLITFLKPGRRSAATLGASGPAV
jgi:hypothetical protein